MRPHSAMPCEANDKKLESLFAPTYSQPFRKLFDHIIYGDIKMRYNVFRKYANDVFDGRILKLKRLVL